MFCILHSLHLWQCSYVFIYHPFSNLQKQFYTLKIVFLKKLPNIRFYSILSVLSVFLL